MSSGLIWGVLCDTLGRKKLLCIGNFLDALFVIIGSLSQSFTVLTVSKFFGGFVANGPFAALTAYLSECHSAKYRARIQMVLGIIYSLAMIILPSVAGIILPMDISVNILNYLNIHSWNIYVFLTATPAILAGCCFIFVPESPKFLMTSGKNDQALEVFKTIYSLNTGRPRNTYPISRLVVEKERKITEFGDKNVHKKEGTMQAFLFELITIRSMFFPPLLKNTLLVCGLQFSLVMR
ncbi:hypothetical protein WA026_004111 [Henosepilachna vigintioctopunctata]|uniref:Major facilitator superfamily (MFS) profile domain-containing protein n=1 Tax=Henosepilachna vigintioctopunctata TaxID=420089 RepID=A0AAW1UER7_9CUCU